MTSQEAFKAIQNAHILVRYEPKDDKFPREQFVINEDVTVLVEVLPQEDGTNRYQAVHYESEMVGTRGRITPNPVAAAREAVALAYA
jgi:hypothetical protein